MDCPCILLKNIGAIHLSPLWAPLIEIDWQAKLVWRLFFLLLFGAQGCSPLVPWHFLICSGVHSSGLPFSSSGHWHPDFFSAQHIIFSSL